ncbi:hypothetical protein AALP_AAs53550U000100 [Arabis alpina]|uniref:Retrovirus-related Pol polyprotein from transposon TNT 1-94-like beta-barrel domain-containing protein n=1 Tax=Arabis alpina TaxID=50452 RepID=A0A087FW78_ARAAL|nr:hypothetical protein AALP_AAs53550U000100 [Arabis alpina]
MDAQNQNVSNVDAALAAVSAAANVSTLNTNDDVIRSGLNEMLVDMQFGSSPSVVVAIPTSGVTMYAPPSVAVHATSAMVPPTVQSVVTPSYPTVQIPSGYSAGLLPDKFDGRFFKMWQKKMYFYLTTLNLEKYVKEVKPLLSADNTDFRALASVHAWDHGDFLCKGYIQSRLNDQLFNVYANVETSKALWEFLDKKYRSEDAGSQKHAVAKFEHYKMVDSRPLMEQVNEVQNLLHEIHAEGMRICQTYQVACVIEKLPPGLTDFKNYLKLKKKWMSLEDLVMKLRIESQNRRELENKGRLDKGKGKVAPQHTQKFKHRGGGGGDTSKPRFTGTCNICHKVGHKSFECRTKMVPRQSNKYEANLTEADMCAVVTEANVAESHPKTWWFDTGATRHICMDRESFSTYRKNTSNEKLFMGNSATSKNASYGKVVLKMTSARELILNNVAHIPDMRKNLISGSLLREHGFAIKIEADKLVLSKQ